MAVDAVEIPSPPSQLPPHFSQSRHFYVAVDRLQFKMNKLVGDVCGSAGRCGPAAVAAGGGVLQLSRRTRFRLCCCLQHPFHFSRISGFYKAEWNDKGMRVEMHSDLSEAERMLIFEKFRQATSEWNQKTTDQPGDDSKTGEEKSHMIVVTDACLPLLALGESPISARILINYELPTKKEAYSRRMTTCLAADGIVINMVVGGEVVTLKCIEESSSLVIAEMPINISDIL